jgi:hypothetical protein
VTVLAASSNDVAPGTLGFLVVAGMGLALFFLFRSMSKHLRKVSDAAREEAARVEREEASAAPVQDPSRPGDVSTAARDLRQSG